MKYQQQLEPVKNQLAQAQNILVVLPEQASVDHFAAGLALYLALKNSGKDVAIASKAKPLVAQSNLFGIGEIKDSLPASSGGDLVLTLEGVVAADGTVPALERLDWFPEGQNLNLVFHVMPGQKFEPKSVTPKASSGGFSTIFAVGMTAVNQVSDLMGQIPAEAFIINTDNNPQNSQFGKINVIDQNSATVSEMIAQILPDLGLTPDVDIASNILMGIYAGTANLTQNVKPETLITAGQAMQAGGKIAQAPAPTAYEQQNFPPFNQVFGDQSPVATSQPSDSIPAPVSASPASVPVVTEPSPVYTEQSRSVPPAPTVDLSKLPFMQNIQQAVAENPQNPEPANPDQAPASQYNQAPPMPSQEERPQGEQAYSGNPEQENPAPDWLTPKVFKGTSIN